MAEDIKQLFDILSEGAIVINKPVSPVDDDECHTQVAPFMGENPFICSEDFM